MPPQAPEATEDYKAIRQQVFTVNYRKLGLAPTEKNPQVWCAIMEIALPQALMSLVCVRGGAVSLYFGSGKTVTGTEQHEAVREKAAAFIDAAQASLKKLNRTKHFPLPELNRVRFYVRTFEGLFTSQANIQIDKETHELFALFRAGHETVAAVKATQTPAPA